MNKLKGKALIAQGGGPTAVINQSLVGVALEARKFSEITAVWGALHGVRGIVNESFLNLCEATSHNLEMVANTPSSALGSTRDKPDLEYCDRIVKILSKHNIRYFFYIGGNDSADTVRIIEEHARGESYELRAIHIPKTIDNDLPLTDHCPGYPSAACFVINALGGINTDIRALPGVYIAVMMGRHAGWLTAAAGLARTHEDDGPHLIYVPERQFSLDVYLGDIERILKQHNRCIVALSEGVWATRNDKGIELPLAADLISRSGRMLEVDAHGNMQLSGGALADELANLVQKALGVKRVRADTFGYLQRSFPGIISRVDTREAREVGEKAVHYACYGQMSGSVAIIRIGNYAVNYELVPLVGIAAKIRRLPEEFLPFESSVVTDSFHKYLWPLLGNQLPNLERLQAPVVSLR